MSERLATVRSFKRRGTRITPGQEAALTSGWPQWGIDDWSSLQNSSAIFGSKDVVLDVGYGMGETTLAMAAADPGRGYLAIDIHRPGAGALLRGIEERALTNVRLIDGDVTELLPYLADQSLGEIRVFFPDPWPKSRHHKRRLIQPAFVTAMTTKLRIGGSWHLATDWEPYAEWMLEVFAALPNLEGGVVPKPDHRPTTRFEAQGLRKGHLVADLRYTKTA